MTVVGTVQLFLYIRVRQCVTKPIKSVVEDLSEARFVKNSDSNSHHKRHFW